MASAYSWICLLKAAECLDVKAHLDCLGKVGVVAGMVVVGFEQVGDRFPETAAVVYGEPLGFLVEVGDDTPGLLASTSLTALLAGTADVSNDADGHADGGSVRELIRVFTVCTVGCAQRNGCSEVQFFADPRDQGCYGT